MDLYTPDRSAAWLRERGIDLRPDTLRAWRERGAFPNAIHVAGGRGQWLIPLADLEAFAQSYTPGPAGRARKS